MAGLVFKMAEKENFQWIIYRLRNIHYRKFSCIIGNLEHLKKYFLIKNTAILIGNNFSVLYSIIS